VTSSIIMTIIGPDRPGLVQSVAEAIRRHGGNWLESRMSRLGGHFAGILRVQIPSELAEGLARELQGLRTSGLQVLLATEPAAPETSASTRLRIDLVGQDRPGIVHEIARTLAASGVNVEELSTECASAAMSGEVLFKAIAQVRLPSHCDPAGLRGQLEKLADDLIVDLTFVELPGTTTPV
jgi:glycine cleavage system regulatory protein